MMAKEWYVIHAYSGYENKVRDALLERINRFDERGPKKFTFIGRDALQDRLNTAVADGKITGEEAAEKLAKFEERINEKRAGLQDRLNTSVIDGKITAEEAAEKLAKFEEIVDSGGKFRGPKFGHGGGNGQRNNANNAVYQGV